jgi:hypothetical protein
MDKVFTGPGGAALRCGGPSCTAVSLAQPLIEPLGFLGGAAEPTAIVLVTIVLTFLPQVMGELAPTD